MPSTPLARLRVSPSIAQFVALIVPGFRREASRTAHQFTDTLGRISAVCGEDLFQSNRLAEPICNGLGDDLHRFGLDSIACDGTCGCHS
ncbi:hypothetical protein [Armatimonas sp.]|uniref:hypothetical protein n=1 Tax=Armatimonas sp. TaxID=1872638 RepID=UPI00374DDD40